MYNSLYSKVSIYTFLTVLCCIVLYCIVLYFNTKVISLEPFQEARICGIHRTVHAGEIGTFEAVKDVS